MDNPILSAAIPTILVHGGVLLVAGVLPLAAFYILDGVVAYFRGRGIAALLLAAGLAAAIAVAGAVAWWWGLDLIAGTPALAPTSAGAQTNANFFFGWAVALGALGFLFRMLNLARGKRKRTA